MASIGPQLPPHLQKRKRTPEDESDTAKASPPAKLSRRENKDEIPLDDNSDEEYGPSVPKAARPSTGPLIGPSLPSNTSGARSESKAQSSPGPISKPRSIGPTLPPAPIATAGNPDEIGLDSDSDSDVGPAAPPRAATTLPIGPTMPPPTKRVLGPAPPPAPLSERPLTNPDSDSDSGSDSDDDGWGPALPSATTNPLQQQNPALFYPSHNPSEPAVPKRDAWMIAPPTEADSYRGPPDPTKLKNRKFAGGGPRSVEKGATGAGPSSIWTETPEEKLKRLTNAVLGREDPSAASSSNPGASSGGGSFAAARKVDEDRVRAFTEQTRGRSLVAEHQARRAAGREGEKKAGRGGKGGGPTKYGGAPVGPDGKEKEEEADDPSKRAFDREKDMAIGGQLSNVKKREIMNQASNFGGRFQKGSYL